MQNNNLLEVCNLVTNFKTDGKDITVLKNISINLTKGRILAVVGESGSGKSVTVNTIINLLPKNATIKNGDVKLYTDDNMIELTKLKQYGKEFRSLRGEKISMIFQDPMASLNPVYTIGDQIKEVLFEHYNITKKEAHKKTIEILEKLGIPDPANRINSYPHQFSGGMKQRVLIAIAMICNPDILIADEPTTALDVTIQAQILDLLKSLQKEKQSSIILITHDLGVVAQIADDVAVMYAGEIVETGSIEQIFKNPKHPYTRSLFNSIPNIETDNKRLHVIDGMVPSFDKLPKKGCRFADRIGYIDKNEHEEDPILYEIEKGHFVRCTCYKNFYFQEDDNSDKNRAKDSDEIVLSVKNLKKYYEPKKMLFKSKGKTVKALDDVSFDMKKGKTIGIVGESGCGKSTLAKSLMKLHDISDGSINMKVNGSIQDISKLTGNDELSFRKNLQMVFQDPYTSLNPVKKIFTLFEEPMLIHGIKDANERLEKMKYVLKMVNLPEDYLHRYPHEFSGGQRQRLSIARALLLDPKVLILDEPVSALDLSVQSQVLNYLRDIQAEKDLSYIFISHDLGVVKYMCDYIYVIHKGRFVECGTTEDIYNNAKHIYTKKLLSAIPHVNIDKREELFYKREKTEKEFTEKEKIFYDDNNRAYDLIKLSDTHYVSIKNINDLE